MASKLQKLQGVPRIAVHDMEWKGFHVRQGYAYGITDDGSLFVSPCVRTDDGGLFMWIARDDKPVICRRRDEVRGGYSTAIGARSVIMEAGNYATPWALCWQESSLPIADTIDLILLEDDWLVSSSLYFCQYVCGVRHHCPVGEDIIFGTKR